MKSCDYYTVPINEGSIKRINGENCFQKCPIDYPYLNLDDRQCKTGCDSGYYSEKNGEKICKTNCGTDYHIVEKTTPKPGLTKCVKYCSIGFNEDDTPKFTYYNTNNKCLDSCNEKYSFKAINKPQKYVDDFSEIGVKYYDKNNYCLRKCNYYSSSNNNLCVDNCNVGEFILPGNICSFSTSGNPYPIEAPFYINVGTDEKKFINVWQIVKIKIIMTLKIQIYYALIIFIIIMVFIII